MVAMRVIWIAASSTHDVVVQGFAAVTLYKPLLNKHNLQIEIPPALNSTKTFVNVHVSVVH